MTAPETGRPAAFFDVDGTITRSDIVTDHVRFRRSVAGGRAGHRRWMALLPARLAGILALDQVSRVGVNRWTYSWYEGFTRDELARWAEDFQSGPGLARVYPRAVELLRRHAAAGHRIVLVSGSLDLILEPLVRRLEQRLPEGAGIRLESVRLRERQDGVFDGAMREAPLGEAEKARRIREVAAEEGLDLARSFAYGDSIADLPALSAVGRPAAVNPDARLRREARRRGWPVLDLRASR